ncbi:MAG: DUF3368 domain-containing protein [Mucilaginibacter sp.]
MSQEFQRDSIVITDTSCLILLDKIEALFVLRILFSQIITTIEIAQEFGQPLPEWIQIKSVIDKDLQYSFSEKVDPGEASAIALALELTSPILVLDDLKGRRLAAQLKLNYTGTLGVLVLAKQSGAISLLKPYFEKIKNTNFRISPVLLQKILTDSEE